MMRPVELEWLRDYSQQMLTIAEIGCWKGETTKVFLSNCKGMVYAIDHFKGSWLDLTALLVRHDNIFNKFMKNVGESPRLKVIRKDSLEAAKEVPSVDMVFIDANHTYKSVREDILVWGKKANVLLCGHDYGIWPGVKRAVDELIPDAFVFKTIWFRRMN